MYVNPYTPTTVARLAELKLTGVYKRLRYKRDATPISNYKRKTVCRRIIVIRSLLVHAEKQCVIIVMIIIREA